MPPEWVGRLTIGTVVRVALHGRRVRGWVAETDVEPEAPPERLRALAKVSSAGPPAEIVDLTAWAAWRWAGPRASLLRTASPPNVVPPGPPGPPGAHHARGFTPSEDREVEEAARRALAREWAVIQWPPSARMADLLRRLVSQGGSTIVLVPDVERVRLLARRLGQAGMAVVELHGDQPDTQRTRAWAQARAGGCVVVGGRIAAWAPVPDLRAAVVVDDVDEAHKDERTPAWHGRDVAVERARRAGVRVTVVSPVPSLDALAHVDGPVLPSESKAREGWPVVTVVDRRDEPPGLGLFSERMVEATRRAVDLGRVVCVLNRRGRATMVACRTCGEVARCERCGARVPEEAAGLVCRVCGTVRPRVCAECGSTDLRRVRQGVERVAEEVAALLPRVQVADVEGGTGEVPDAGVLVGTESVLHRVDRAVLVVLLDFDAELLAPRFRAAEQALWLVVRSARLVGGRREGGAVMIQTRMPDHEVVVAAQRGAPQTLVDTERRRRADLGLPPFGAIALATGSSEPVGVLAEELGERAGVSLLGPAQRGRSAELLIRASGVEVLCDALGGAAPIARRAGRLRVEVDPLRA